MNIWGKRTDVAAALALEGAARYPQDKAFLTELVRMMLWAKKPEEMEVLRLKVVALSNTQ